MRNKRTRHPESDASEGDARTHKTPSEAQQRTYGAESAPDDTTSDIIARGAEKDQHDAEVSERKHGVGPGMTP